MPGEASTQMVVLNILEPGQCLTIAEMEQVSGSERRKLVNGAAGLMRRGMVERVEAGCYQLTECGLTAKKSGAPLTSGPNDKLTAVKRYRNTYRERLWRAMRIRKKFTADDLVMLASRGDEKSPKSNAYKYLNYLRRAGYLLEMPRRIPDGKLTSNGMKQYLLDRDHGPMAPVVRTAKKEIFDPNIKKPFLIKGDRS